MSPSACKHARPVWRLAECNETGWICDDCNDKPGEPPGFSPALDRSNVYDKVSGILMELHAASFVYCSNSDHGEHVTAEVVKRCRAENTFDQLSIIRFLCDALDGGTRAVYWRRISAGVLLGNDTRDRCDCGALALVYTGGKHYCSDHGCDIVRQAFLGPL